MNILLLFPFGLRKKDLEALSKAELITPNWKPLLQITTPDEEPKSMKETNTKSMTDITASSTFQLVSDLIIEKPLEDISEDTTQVFKLKSSVQHYLSENTTQHNLKLFEHKLYFLTAFSVSLIQLTRAYNRCSERLMEHSLICASEFWNPSILDKKYNQLKKNFISDSKAKANLNDLQKLFDEHKSNLNSIFDRLDQEALKNLIKDSNTPHFPL